MSKSPIAVPSILVIPHQTNPIFVRKMKDVLTRQGQIEPLQVRQVGNHYIPWEDDPWGSETAQAAIELGWSTLLIVVTKKYIR